MKLIIVHDSLGRIVSVGQVLHEGKRGFGILPKPGHMVGEFEAAGSIAEKTLIDIHNHCVVDVKKGKLVLRSQGTASA